MEGQFTGSIELDASSRIDFAAGAEIQVEVLRAHTVVVRCYVTGTIHAQVVEIASTARVTGTVQYDVRLSIEPGVRMRASIESPGF